jgi:hypothetical protein
VRYQAALRPDDDFASRKIYHYSGAKSISYACMRS